MQTHGSMDTMNTYKTLEEGGRWGRGWVTIAPSPSNILVLKVF